MTKEDELTKKLAELRKKFAESGRPLIDNSSKIKAMGFVGGVRRPPSKISDCED